MEPPVWDLWVRCPGHVHLEGRLVRRHAAQYRSPEPPNPDVLGCAERSPSPRSLLPSSERDVCNTWIPKQGRLSKEPYQRDSQKVLDTGRKSAGRTGRPLPGAVLPGAFSSRVSFPRYVQPPVISFEAIFEQSTPNSPIVFILSPGSDPASDLMKLAEHSGFGGNRLKFLAMGQGQEKVNCCWREQALNVGEVTGPC